MLWDCAKIVTISSQQQMKECVFNIQNCIQNFIEFKESYFPSNFFSIPTKSVQQYEPETLGHSEVISIVPFQGIVPWGCAETVTISSQQLMKECVFTMQTVFKLLLRSKSYFPSIFFLPIQSNYVNLVFKC